MDWRWDEWEELAECLGASPEVRDFFFSEDIREQAKAQTICSTCPVVEECLLYALETRQMFGVWGMHTPADRRNLRRFVSRNPERAQHHWDYSFAKILNGLESTLIAEAADRPSLAAV